MGLAIVCVVCSTTTRAADPPAAPFAIQVIDEATNRGVPLVELTTTTQQKFVTDSAGYVAIDAPELLGRKVYFHVRSHGYEFPQDGFGFRGKGLEVVAGGEATLQISRINIAERLYRVTGAGIYSESVKLGRPTPLAEPLLAGGVGGQDSVQACVHQGRILWFWGDTNRLAYPLGLFRTSGASSALPGAGGLDPSVGVDLKYWVNDQGFSRAMFDLEGPGVVWMDGLTTVPDADGKSRVIGHYSRRQGLEKQLAHGIAEFDPDAAMFHSLATLPDEAVLHPLGQSCGGRSDMPESPIHFANPFPSVRVAGRFEAVSDPSRYEGFTPLRPGTRFEKEQSEIERDAEGNVVYAWKRDTPPLSTTEEHELIEAGKLPAAAARWQTVDAATGERVQLHAGSVRWNAFRNRWILIAVQQYGEPSFLGEVWYAEAGQPEGPWTKCTRIVTHDKYTFYNPVQHDFFDQEGGRVIYFEGTYASTFSRTTVPTPRYDYNQVMYRLDLADPRLSPSRGE